MLKFGTEMLLLSTTWNGWRRSATWAACIGVILFLGAIRTATDAELAVASFALLPVLVIAWIGGKASGVLMASLAATMWIAADIASDRQFSAAWIPWTNFVARLITYNLVALLTAEIRVLLTREYEQASQDALTGLQNRRAFLEVGSAEIERAKRYSHPLAVIFIDLDNFKKLNDKSGHEAGDAALQATARALSCALRSSDRVARLGGDEFAVLLPEIKYDATVDTVRKLASVVNRALGKFPPVGASLGVAWFGEMDRAFTDMLSVADKLMYQVKASGKGAILARQVTERGEPSLRTMSAQ